MILERIALNPTQAGQMCNHALCSNIWACSNAGASAALFQTHLRTHLALTLQTHHSKHIVLKPLCDLMVSLVIPKKCVFVDRIVFALFGPAAEIRLKLCMDPAVQQLWCGPFSIVVMVCNPINCRYITYKP